MECQGNDSRNRLFRPELNASVFRIICSDFSRIAFAVEDHVDGFDPVRHGGDVRGKKLRGGKRVAGNTEGALIGKNGFRILVMHSVACGTGVADCDFRAVRVFVRTEKVFDVNQRPGEFVQQFLVQFAQLGGRNGLFLIGGRFPRCGGDCFRYGEQCAGGNQNGECQQLFSIHLMTPLVGLLNVV